MFEESSIDDLWHCRQVGDLMGGEEFQTLKKIMDTDTYVQEVTTDNEHLVNYFEVSGGSRWPVRQLDNFCPLVR